MSIRESDLIAGSVVVVQSNRTFCGFESGVITGHSTGGHDGLVCYYTDAGGGPKWCLASQIIDIQLKNRVVRE
ncbi:hypothetical protein [Ethanoligenens harbinense]|uniref:TBC domain containing protein n=1 Tax=Ethanoligenens harbinense (strain DSM 18485 / JCM 12961 / CGMCC 1.5033 / YUAN-3) TaxID=663278 RepID=E6U5S5_ETHHY|nr:hypothetical protein [Ethanoligenens harbinense]ADU27942.1 TBC domain containing protein [Ethanoligenens harbinense YUAN-3]